MANLERMYKLADLVSLTKELRVYGRYENNFLLPERDTDLDHLLFTMTEDLSRTILPQCQVVFERPHVKITFPTEMVEKALFLEQALYVHHYSSPLLADFISNFVYLMNEFGTRLNPGGTTMIKIDLSTVYRKTSDKNFNNLIVKLKKMSDFVGSFDTQYDQHRTNIDNFVRISQERVAKLKAIQEGTVTRNPFSAISGQIAKSKEALATKLTNVPTAPTTAVAGSLSVGTEIRVIKLIRSKIPVFMVYPKHPAALPEKATIVSENDTIIKVTTSRGNVLYVSGLGYVCEFDKHIWDYGINSKPIDRLYYDPVTAVFTVFTENGECIPFNSFALADEFIRSMNLNIVTTEIHVMDSQEVVIPMQAREGM